MRKYILENGLRDQVNKLIESRYDLSALPKYQELMVIW